MAPQAKKNRVRCKNAGLHHSHSTNPFLRSKKGKWRRRQKKIRGTVRNEQENFKVPSFQSSGVGRGVPKVPKNQGSGVYRPFFGVFRVRIPSFFPFFFWWFCGHFALVFPD